MPKTLIAVADSVFPSLAPTEQVFSRLDAELRLAGEATPEGILAVARQADALMVTYAQITAQVIEGLERCKAIGRFGIGVDNIDLEAAAKAGITVTYAPDYCLDEVSDHAMALLMSLARKVTFSDRQVQAGRWEMKATVPLRRLRGSTLGLVGLGQIPRALAPKAQGLGLKVIASDPFVDQADAAAMGVELVSFEDLLARSDYVSIHAPLLPQTKGLFNAQAFARMQSHAILINTARGPLVNEDDLAAALDAGEIGGAGLDVVTTEPLAADSPLLGRDNVIITPHTAFYSEDALLDLQTKVAEDVASVLEGKAPRYPVKLPDVA